MGYGEMREPTEQRPGAAGRRGPRAPARHAHVRIAYVCYIAAYTTDGVNEKIAAQIATWRNLGHEVALYCLSPPARTRDEVPRVQGSIRTFTSTAGRVQATVSLARDVRRFAPDIVYVRHDLFLPPLPPLLWPLSIVLEINTDDRAETRLDGGAGWIYNEATRRATFRASAGLVCVTNELAHAPSVARFGKPSIVIGNAGDADDAGPLAAPPRSKRRSAVMLVGYMAPWAGVDKLRELCEAMPLLDVHLVGAVGDAAGAGPALPNLHIHGRLDRARYRPILAAADFGIGPLALHRKGMSEATPLKVRDYLSNGLPVLIAHLDTDFPGEAPWYLLQLPNTEETIRDSLPAIERWIESVAGRRVPRDEVRERIGIDAKERVRVAFFEDVAGRRRRRRRG